MVLRRSNCKLNFRLQGFLIRREGFSTNFFTVTSILLQCLIILSPRNVKLIETLCIYQKLELIGVSCDTYNQCCSMFFYFSKQIIFTVSNVRIDFFTYAEKSVGCFSYTTSTFILNIGRSIVYFFMCCCVCCFCIERLKFYLSNKNVKCGVFSV